ncbi:hypothetical protein QOZ80_4AG0322120 [Eleusine coracana subsp. coracana]|nr:hypothetical protein QOZ80_4AG0322120 [Eleusine coracana subsp. coracana]
MKLLPYAVVDRNGKPHVRVQVKEGDVRELSPEEVSAMVLTRMKETAEAFLGEKQVTHAVVTVPAYLNDAQKQATKDAGVIAGLKVLRILNEPTAAAIAFECECERAKRAMSSQHQVRVEVEALFDGVDFSETLTRARFEELNNDLFRKTMIPVKKAMADAGLGKDDIDEIVLAHQPREAVAFGAAVQGSILSGRVDNKTKDVVLLDVTPLTLGIQTLGGVMTKLIPRNTVVPTKKTQVFTTYEDRQSTVSINLLEGERSMTKNNRLLGKFELSGIPPAPRGTPQIEVTFEVDLPTRAPKSRRRSPSPVTSTGTARRRLIGWCARRGCAEEFAEEDRMVRERVDARNKLEAYVYNIKSTVDSGNKLADKMDANDKDKVEEAVRETNEWLDNNQEADKEDYDEKLKELEDVCNLVISAVYQRSGGGTQEAENNDEDDHAL